jgi:hypothetical protein
MSTDKHEVHEVKVQEVNNSSEVKPLVTRAAEIDAQLAEITLREREADLRIKMAKLAEIELNESTRKNQALIQCTSLKDFNNAQRAEKYACNHCKGGIDGQGKIGTGDATSNFCLHINTYPMGERVILCTRCQFEWHPGDQGEYIIRNGRKVKNPTGISYKHALVMAAKTTNKPSSSIIFTITQNAPVESDGNKEQYPDE